MDQDQQQELTFEESLKQVMQTLPPVIRNYLSQGKYTPVAKGLMAKYGLHIDQATVLEREIMLLLMGIENPDEFTQSLAGEGRLDEQTVNGIMQDINVQIFIPLREEMKKMEEKPVQATAPVAPRTIQPQKYFHLENKIAPTAHPSVSSFAPQPPKSVLPKPIDSSTLLEDHEEPHIEFSKTPSTPAETPLHKVLRSVMPPSVPLKATQSTAPNLPGAMPPTPVPSQGINRIPSGGHYPVSPAATTPPTQPKPVLPAAPKVPPAPAKPYTVDPYREPIE